LKIFDLGPGWIYFVVQTLRAGVFKLPRAGGRGAVAGAAASELAMILDGIDVSKLKRLPRYERGAR